MIIRCNHSITPSCSWVLSFPVDNLTIMFLLLSEQSAFCHACNRLILRSFSSKYSICIGRKGAGDQKGLKQASIASKRKGQNKTGYATLPTAPSIHPSLQLLCPLSSASNVAQASPKPFLSIQHHAGGGRKEKKTRLVSSEVCVRAFLVNPVKTACSLLTRSKFRPFFVIQKTPRYFKNKDTSSSYDYVYKNNKIRAQISHQRI